jgi:gamma-glutamylcyclotransferase (GGCT)/AIG2-like uncharacterized protein YtfP
MTAVFVYGTLMPGQVRWPQLAPYAAAPVSQDQVGGRLVDTGSGYPGLLPEDTGEVHGFVVELQPALEDIALRRLDEVEGTDVGLYRRVQVKTASGRTCWTYELLVFEPWMPDLGGRWIR